MPINAPLALALLLAPSWAYLVGTAIAARRFAARRPPAPHDRPPISVLKPLHGIEPMLDENLRSFVAQDYPEIQIVLGVNDPHDDAIAAAHALIGTAPECDIELVIGDGTGDGNRKIANLEAMMPAVRHDVLVLADSDMRVGPKYLASVTAPLADPRIGIVTCLYKGVPTGGRWSDLGALQINFGFLPGALLADALAIGRGCFGATIALRRQTLAQIGGFARLRYELADDYRIGDLVRREGLAVVLSPHLVETMVSERSFVELWRHELRWARTVRAMAPLGFAGSVFSHPVALAGLALIATRFGLTSWVFLTISCLLRWISARATAGALGLSTAQLWLLPARDALSFAVFLASFFGRTVFWRDQHFRVESSGRIPVDGDMGP